jgi:hypothetical protein
MCEGEDVEDDQARFLCSWRRVVEAEVKAVRLSANQSLSQVDLPLFAEANCVPERAPFTTFLRSLSHSFLPRCLDPFVCLAFHFKEQGA